MEAVNIKRKSITLVLMLLALALTLSANTVFATSNTTTNISDQNTGQVNQINGQNLNESTEKSSKQEISSKQTGNLAAGSPTATDKAAAGSAASTKTVTTTKKFTSSQINSAATTVKNFVEKNKRLPNYVTISSVQVSMPQFLKLMTWNVININGKHKKSVTLTSVKNPTSNPKETVKKGSITKSQYVRIASSIIKHNSKWGNVPNSWNTSRGRLNFQNLVYTYAKILNFQAAKNRLPTTVSVSTWSSLTSTKSEGGPSEGSVSTGSQSKYLKASANAQSTSSTIKNLAASITKGKTSTYAKAQAIFNWVRDHISYSFYYNTKKGALGALSSRSANCVDNSHLMVALARAAKIPARYQHGTCKFSGGTYGHVWAQLYVNGKWYYADGISKRNSFGTIKNWNLNTYRLHGTYASLPF